MKKIIANAYSVTKEYQSYLSYMVFCACLFVAIIYGFNLYNAISLTVSLQKIDKNVEEVKGRVQSLEAKYISLSSNITPEMAKNYGLHEVPVTAYINRNNPLGAVVSIKSEL